MKPSGEKIRVDWHGHSDRGLAIANSLAAIIAGANCVHGCAIGLGERVGNTQIDQMLVNLKLMGIAPWDQQDLTQAETILPGGVAGDGCADSGELSRGRRRCVPHRNRACTRPRSSKPIAKNDAVLANTVYSGVPSHVFGMEQTIDIGPMSGKSNVLFWLERRGIAGDRRCGRPHLPARQAERPHAERGGNSGVRAAAAHRK